MQRHLCLPSNPAQIRGRKLWKKSPANPTRGEITVTSQLAVVASHNRQGGSHAQHPSFGVVLFRGKVHGDRNLKQLTVHACLAPHLVMMSETQQPSICCLSPTNVLLLANNCHELGSPGASLGIDVGEAVTKHLLLLTPGYVSQLMKIIGKEQNICR